MNSTNCINCGAPLTKTLCLYCGTPYIEEDDTPEVVVVRGGRGNMKLITFHSNAPPRMKRREAL